MIQEIISIISKKQQQATINFKNSFQNLDDNIVNQQDELHDEKNENNKVQVDQQTKEMKSVKGKAGETLELNIKEERNNEYMRQFQDNKIQKHEGGQNKGNIIKLLQNQEDNIQNQQNQGSFLPRPKINMKKNQQTNSKKRLKSDNSDNKNNQKSIDNQFHQISLPKRTKQSQLKVQIKGQNQANPQQYLEEMPNPHIPSGSQQNIQNNNFANIRLRKHIKVLDRNHISIKTQIKSLNNMNSFEQQNNIQLPFLQGSSKSRSNMRINSGVVSYCESLRSSKVVQPSSRNQNQKQIGTLKNVRKLGRQKQYSSLNSKNRNYRYKTEQSLNKNTNIEEYYNSQVEAKIQLRVIFQKKKKLQQKLKKLNKQLQKLSTQQSQRIQQNLYSYSSPSQPLHKQKSSPIYKLFKNNKYSNNIIKRDINKQHINQLQNSRRAIQFVEKVSKQSMKRRITHNKKVNKIIIDRAKNHVCMDCSRIKCQVEVIEGEVRSQTHL